MRIYIFHVFTALSRRAFACSSFLLFEGAPTVFGFESLRVTVRLKVKDDAFDRMSLLGCVDKGMSCVCVCGAEAGAEARGGEGDDVTTLSLSITKNPRRSN